MLTEIILGLLIALVAYFIGWVHGSVSAGRHWRHRDAMRRGAEEWRIEGRNVR
jgi:hypothetical protein